RVRAERPKPEAVSHKARQLAGCRRALRQRGANSERLQLSQSRTCQQSTVTRRSPFSFHKADRSMATKQRHHHVRKGPHGGMQLVLIEDVPNLGRQGDVVEVKPGYGRNYLLPNGLAT